MKKSQLNAWNSLSLRIVTLIDKNKTQFEP